MDYLKLLEESYQIERLNQPDGQLTRLCFLADHVFAFTTYDDDMSELFAAKAVEFCAVITNSTAFDHIKDQDSYRWFLTMVNAQFFAERLEWGTSVRGAFWIGDQPEVSSCGLWQDGQQLDGLTFARSGAGIKGWQAFIAAVRTFAAAPRPA